MDTHKMLLVGGAVLMVVIIVAVDVLFFRNNFWGRLIANVGIVLVFAALYLGFLK